MDLARAFLDFAGQQESTFDWSYPEFRKQWKRFGMPMIHLIPEAKMGGSKKANSDTMRLWGYSYNLLRTLLNIFRAALLHPVESTQLTSMGSAAPTWSAQRSSSSSSSSSRARNGPVIASPVAPESPEELDNMFGKQVYALYSLFTLVYKQQTDRPLRIPLRVRVGHEDWPRIVDFARKTKSFAPQCTHPFQVLRLMRRSNLFLWCFHPRNNVIEPELCEFTRTPSLGADQLQPVDMEELVDTAMLEARAQTYRRAVSEASTVDTEHKANGQFDLLAALLASSQSSSSSSSSSSDIAGLLNGVPTTRSGVARALSPLPNTSVATEVRKTIEEHTRALSRLRINWRYHGGQTSHGAGGAGGQPSSDERKATDRQGGRGRNSTSIHPILHACGKLYREYLRRTTGQRTHFMAHVRRPAAAPTPLSPSFATPVLGPQRAASAITLPSPVLGPTSPAWPAHAGRSRGGLSSGQSRVAVLAQVALGGQHTGGADDDGKTASENTSGQRQPPPAAAPPPLAHLIARLGHDSDSESDMDSLRSPMPTPALGPTAQPFPRLAPASAPAASSSGSHPPALSLSRQISGTASVASGFSSRDLVASVEAALGTDGRVPTRARRQPPRTRTRSRTAAVARAQTETATHTASHGDSTESDTDAPTTPQAASVGSGNTDRPSVRSVVRRRRRARQAAASTDDSGTGRTKRHKTDASSEKKQQAPRSTPRTRAGRGRRGRTQPVRNRRAQPAVAVTTARSASDTNDVSADMPVRDEPSSSRAASTNGATPVQESSLLANASQRLLETEQALQLLESSEDEDDDDDDDDDDPLGVDVDMEPDPDDDVAT